METPAENALPQDLNDRVAVATGEAPADPADNPDVVTAASPMAQGIAASIVHGLSVVVCPNWDVTDSERAMLAEPLAEIVHAWLPADPNAEPNPYVALIIAAAVIAGPRIAGGVPLRPPKDVTPREEPRARQTVAEPTYGGAG